MHKDKKVSARTISLPLTLARRAERVAGEEGRTLSELFRESFRLYEREYLVRSLKREKRTVAWKKIRRTLVAVGKRGARKDLAMFIIQDRASH